MKGQLPNGSGRVSPESQPLSDLNASQTVAEPASLSNGHPPTAQRLRTMNFAHYSLLALLLAVGAAVFYIVRIFVVPIILAAVFAGLFYPIYERFLKLTRARKAFSALLCCLIFSLGLLLPACVVANLVAKEAVRLYQTSQSRVQGFFDQNWTTRLQENSVLHKLNLDKLPVQASVETFGKKAAELLIAIVNRASRQTFEFISTIFITLFTMFYFLRDGPGLLRVLKDLSPLAQAYEERLIVRFISVSRATIKGVLLIAIMKGTVGGVTFWAFGIEAPALWGVVIFCLSILPVVGPWVVMCPAALLMMLSGNIWQGILLLLIATLIVGSIDNVLEPILIGRDGRMHELLVFFSMLGGLAVIGVAGIIIGPLLAALFRTLLDIYAAEFRQQLSVLHVPPQLKQPTAVQ